MTERILLVLVLVAGLLLSPVAVAAQDDVRPAELAIEQPSYVDGDVVEQPQDNLTAYEAQGERLLIRPQNFEGEQVVNYGVDTDVGELRYDDDLDLFVFSPEGEQGTFDVYWVVNEPVTRTVTANNSTTNVTEMEQRRYQARIQVTGQAELSHLQPGQLSSLRDDAESWRDWNATLQDVREMDLMLVPGDISTEALLQGMVNTYVTARDPIQALFGGTFTSIGLLYVTSIGGAVWLVLWLLIPVSLSRKLRKRLNIHESTEAAEGTIGEKLADIDEAQRKQALQNVDWEDRLEDEHVAAAFRDAFGETVYDGYKRLTTILQPELLVRDRLQAMDQSGYGAIVDRDDDGEIADVEVVHEDDTDEDLESLANPSDEFLEALDWEDETILRFDLIDSEYDPEDLDTVPETMDLTTILDRVDLQLEHFEDETAVAGYLYEFVESVRTHPYTDDEGKPRTIREILSQWLKLSQTMRDRYHLPIARIQAEHLERAIVDYDPGEQAERLVSEIQEGRHD